MATDGTTNGHSEGHINDKGEIVTEPKGFKYGEGDLLALATPPKFDSIEKERAYLKERLVAAIRIFAKFGLDHHVAGHLTVRDPEEPTNFWVNPFGLAFALMTVSDLILVDHKGNVIGGGKPGRRVVNLAGFLIHSSIHKARPEVNAICHSHSIYGKAFSALGIPLDITTQDACTFYNDCALLPAFGGVVIDSEEGNQIADALQQKKAIILQNHGLLTVGTTIDTALMWFIMLETQCQVQLLADAAALGRGIQTKPIHHEEAQLTYDQIGSETSGYFGASVYFQTIEKEQGHEYKQTRTGMVASLALSLISALALVGTSTAQNSTGTGSANTTGVPTCAVTCVVSVLPSSPCATYGITNLTCICTSTAFQAAYYQCQQTTCGAADLAAAEAYGATNCAANGTPINITAVTSGAATSTSTSTSTSSAAAAARSTTSTASSAATTASGTSSAAPAATTSAKAGAAKPVVAIGALLLGGLAVLAQ
ncbi:class II aldolase/adducin domain containing protein [Pseudohyphozyma bogoriensis]|nr:class II aldolase/adducin domain containing protein [Pseudohyphozyma bogoriensis]